MGSGKRVTPAVKAEVLTLHWEGMDYQDIAERLDLKPGNVYALLYRHRKAVGEGGVREQGQGTDDVRAYDRFGISVVSCPDDEELGYPMFNRGAKFCADDLAYCELEGAWPDGIRFEIRGKGCVHRAVVVNGEVVRDDGKVLEWIEGRYRWQVTVP